MLNVSFLGSNRYYINLKNGLRHTLCSQFCGERNCIEYTNLCLSAKRGGPETLSSGSLVLDIGANGGSRVTSKLDLNKGSILMFKGISKVRLLLPLKYKGISKIWKI